MRPLSLTQRIFKEFAQHSEKPEITKIEKFMIKAEDIHTFISINNSSHETDENLCKAVKGILTRDYNCTITN